MRRRSFLLGAVVLATAMRHALAQSVRMKRVAMVHPATKPDEMSIGGDPTFEIIFEEMKRLGYVEGANLVVDRYSAEGRFNRFPEIAHEVVATQPDVICAMSNPLVLALKTETRTIPIVAWTSDPVAAEIVSSLAHPGGNITGVSIDAGLEVVTKRVQLFAEAVGKLSNARLLTQAKLQMPYFKMTMEAAERLNIILRLEPLQPPINEAEYNRAFEAMQRDHVDGVLRCCRDSENYTHRVLLGHLAKQYRLPAICWYSDSVKAGALMSHGFDLKSGLAASLRRWLKF